MVPLIVYDTWKKVPTKTKDKIYKLIEAGFVVDPRSKKSLIQNAGICFRQFKSTPTTKYITFFKDISEKLKHLPIEYSLIQ